ncbi:MAG TPA: sensor histidine kinase [Azospirillaceae bacterium]|nr:sensor histidine kinase [Azospirillaceae bacterium]
MGLVLAATLPVVAFAAVVLVRFATAEAEFSRERQLALARSVSAAIDRELDALTTALDLLAAAPELGTGDMAGFHARALATARTRRDGSVVLYDREGQQLVNTNLPYGAPLPRRVGTPRLERVLATAAPQVTDLFVGVPLGRRLVAVDVPVMRGGRVEMVLSTGVTPAGLTGLLEAQGLPAGWIVVVADRSGTIVARIPSADRFVGQSINTAILKQLERAEAGVFPSVTLEGIAVYTAYLRSPRTGWITAVGAPRAEVDASWNAAVWMMLGGGALLAGAAVALALVAGRRIAAPIHALAGMAQAFGRGEPVDGRPSRLREVEAVAGALSAAVAERQRGEEKRALLMREVDHRAKNALTVVQAVVRLTRADSPGAFAAAVNGRIAALARAHRLLAAGEWSGADLDRLLREELNAFVEPGARVTLDGPALRIAADAVQPLGMVFHELATNAVKHGALGAAGGRVTVRWSVSGDGFIDILWEETGGPAIAGPPAGDGIGSTVLQAVAAQLDGTYAVEWRPAGLAGHLRMPASWLVPAAGA